MTPEVQLGGAAVMTSLSQRVLVQPFVPSRHVCEASVTPQHSGHHNRRISGWEHYEKAVRSCHVNKRLVSGCLWAKWWAGLVFAGIITHLCGWIPPFFRGDQCLLQGRLGNYRTTRLCLPLKWCLSSNTDCFILFKWRWMSDYWWRTEVLMGMLKRYCGRIELNYCAMIISLRSQRCE